MQNSYPNREADLNHLEKRLNEYRSRLIHFQNGTRHVEQSPDSHLTRLLRPALQESGRIYDISDYLRGVTEMRLRAWECMVWCNQQLGKIRHGNLNEPSIQHAELEAIVPTDFQAMTIILERAVDASARIEEFINDFPPQVIASASIRRFHDGVAIEAAIGSNRLNQVVRI